MGYKALITLDLTSATEKQREIFYDYLRNKQWVKSISLTTAWRASFKDNVQRDDAARILEQELLGAKAESKVTKVEYAYQLDTFDIVIKTIKPI